MTNGNFFNYQSNEFSRIGSGFAGEFCFRFYSKVSLKWDFSRQKKGAWPPRSCGDRLNGTNPTLPNHGIHRLTPAGPPSRRAYGSERRLCSSPKVQMLSPFGLIRVHSVTSWFKNVQRLNIRAGRAHSFSQQIGLFAKICSPETSSCSAVREKILAVHPTTHDRDSFNSVKRGRVE